MTLKIFKDISWQNILKRYSKIYILFSGGKDSLAALLKVLEVVDKNKITVVFNEVTGNTAEENISFVKKVTEELGLQLIYYKHPLSFWDYVKKYFLPGPVKRWCYRIFKRDYWKNLTGIIVTGLKKSDSKFREMKYGPVVYNGKQIIVNPIWNLSPEEVWDIIKLYGYKIETYEKFGCNMNCIFALFITKKLFVK